MRKRLHRRPIIDAAVLAAILTTAFSVLASAAPAGAGPMLVKPPGSGDGQHQSEGASLPQPLRVRVVSSAGDPIAGAAVRFAVAAVPAQAEGARLGKETVVTGPDGYAQTSFRLGSAAGEYLVTASLQHAGETNTVVFRATARPSNWLLVMLVGLAGGLGVFLFGLRELSEGLRRTAAERIRAILSTLTNNRLLAVGAGAFVTMLVQSSTATTVMLVGFVRAGLMSFPQSIGMILGADIGTTITVQLIAFQLSEYALLLVAIGFALMLTSRDRLKDIGEAVLGCGLLFFGMYVMSTSMAPIHTHQRFLDLLISLENPVLGIAVGALFTALIHSSGAFIGILIVLGTQGLITLEAAIPLLLGANIGTCVTALLACIGARREAQRVALAHVLIKVVGVLVFVWWIPQFAEFVRRISPSGNPLHTGAEHLADVLPRQIANAHTAFNLALTAAMLPLTNVAARLITRLLPDRPEVKKAPYRTRHIDNAMLASPALALNLAKAEVLHMGAIVESMVERVILPFTERAGEVPGELARDEEKVNYLEDQIQRYLGAIGRKSLEKERIDEVFQMMYAVAELEQIGDIIVKNLIPRAREWLEGDLRFSRDGRAELLDYHLRAVKQLARAMAVFQDVNLEAASRMDKKHEKYRKMEDEYLRSHFDRLVHRVPETMESSEFHQELMEQFRRINSHSTRIARILLEGGKEFVKTKNKPAARSGVNRSGS
jgi:phosphate:Na+ symporter